MSSTPKTCGDYGGVTAAGKPCKRQAGWKTDHPGEGRCYQHTEEADAAMQAKKRRVLEVLSGPYGSITKAALDPDVKLDPGTLWRWRQADPVWDAQLNAIVEEADAKRVQMVEDGLYARILAGKATAAECIFYLCNRAPERWKHVQHIQWAPLTEEQRVERLTRLIETAQQRKGAIN